VRIVLDATPMLGVRTGIGRYVDHLVRELPGAFERHDLDASIALSTWTVRRDGARTTELPDLARVGPRVPARALLTAWSVLDQPRIERLVGRCDVFHGTNFVSPPTRHAREVVTVHDLTYALHRTTVSATSRRYRTLVARAISRGAHVVVPSEATAHAVRDFYDLEASRVTTTPLGVDESWLTSVPPAPGWLASRGLPSDYVVFVGSLDPRKNLPQLLEAHRIAQQEQPGFPDLVLAGPAGREHSLEGRPGVHLTGWLEDDELRALVAGSHALVLPSIDEGFGLPVLEALASGRPVVVSDIPALVEVSGDLGTLAAVGDVMALAAALVAVLDAPDTTRDRDARRDWARRWTWAACADRTVEAYSNAV
jgi:glycosyltransferase involved in cell wall biosynthesis